MTYDENNISRITEAKILLLMCLLSFFLCAIPYIFVTGCTSLFLRNTAAGLLNMIIALILIIPVRFLQKYTIAVYIQN